MKFITRGESSDALADDLLIRETFTQFVPLDFNQKVYDNSECRNRNVIKLQWNLRRLSQIFSCLTLKVWRNKRSRNERKRCDNKFLDSIFREKRKAISIKAKNFSLHDFKTFLAIANSTETAHKMKISNLWKMKAPEHITEYITLIPAPWREQISRNVRPDCFYHVSKQFPIPGKWNAFEVLICCVKKKLRVFTILRPRL